jgi:hypothetical protein
MNIRKPPSTANIATQTDKTGKLHAPSAARNANAICAVLKSIAPTAGTALEIASGTGQHIVTFAAAMPDITWHPTEVAANRIASIQTYLDDAALPNITPPIMLNATSEGWGTETFPKTLITLSNLLHLISKAEANTLISEAAKALAPDGKLFLYGPFKRGGELVSEGDMTFDASIRASDPETGYKDDNWVKLTAKNHGLILDQAIEMPANNLALVFRKTS